MGVYSITVIGPVCGGLLVDMSIDEQLIDMIREPEDKARYIADDLAEILTKVFTPPRGESRHRDVQGY